MTIWRKNINIHIYIYIVSWFARMIILFFISCCAIWQTNPKGESVRGRGSFLCPRWRPGRSLEGPTTWLIRGLAAPCSPYTHVLFDLIKLLQLYLLKTKVLIGILLVNCWWLRGAPISCFIFYVISRTMFKRLCKQVTLSHEKWRSQWWRYDDLGWRWQ